MKALAGFDLKRPDGSCDSDNYRYNGDAFFINGGASREFICTVSLILQVYDINYIYIYIYIYLYI